MNKKPSSFSLSIVLLGIAGSLILFLSACTAHVTVTTREDLRQAYLSAVSDAAIAEPGEISRDLTAITAANEQLMWKDTPGKSFLRVVTWTDWSGYDDKTGKAMTLEQEVWVTAAPMLKEFCRAADMGSQDLTLRLEQLLGLPPHGGKDRFVEFWADPNDLFRPSPDPGISDHEAELDFPVSGRFVTISREYIRWFNDLKRDSYSGNAFPWTRLGYTYDWGNPESEVGLSEFVIRKGAVVSIRGVYTIEDYCR